LSFKTYVWNIRFKKYKLLTQISTTDSAYLCEYIIEITALKLDGNKKAQQFPKNCCANVIN